MKFKPYWANPIIEKTSLTECITSCPVQPIEKILEVKRKAARKACSQILNKDPKVEIVALLGSVGHGDIIGWFSDIDMLVITDKPREDEMVEVDHQVLFLEHHSWTSFKDLMTKKIARDEYEERSSYLFFYGNPHYLYSPEKSKEKYQRIIRLGIEAFWRDYPQTNEYLDDFVWFYGSAIESQRNNQSLTAMGKLQRGTILLLRYYLIKNRILLRKPLPDNRTMIQLRNSQVPKELVDYIEQMYQGKLNIVTLLQRGREMYLQITDRRKWLNKIQV